MTTVAKKILLAVVLLSLSPVAMANRVLSVTPNGEQVNLTCEAPHHWRLNDSICVYAGGRKAACGFVARLSDRDLLVKVSTTNFTLATGQTVTLRPDSRTPASTMTSEEAAQVREEKVIDFAAGIMTGFTYFLGSAQVNLAVARQWSLGVEPLFSFEQNVKSYGGFVNLTYYYTHFAFRGVMFNVGAGFYNLMFANNNLSTTPFAVQGTVGWRGKAHWALDLDLGVNAGVQYVAQDSTFYNGPYTANGFHGVLPVINAFVGYSF